MQDTRPKTRLCAYVEKHSNYIFRDTCPGKDAGIGGEQLVLLVDHRRPGHQRAR